MDPAITSPAQMEIVSPNGMGGFMGGSSVAMALLSSGFRVESLRANGVLQKDEWKRLDEAVLQISRQRLRATGDLMGRGLTYSVPNALGVTRLEWERVADMGAADINMSGLSSSTNDRLTWDLVGMPLPIIHKNFQINIRALEASRNRGMPLDTAQAEVAARKVAESVESLIFAGGFSAGANGSIYGYTNFPSRNTGSTTADWNTATGDQIVGDVLAMINKAQADYFFGPYVIYVSAASYVHMGDDYKAGSDKTIISRVLEIPGIEAVMPSDNITDHGQVIMVQMSRDVVDMVDGIQPTVISWESQGGMVVNFKVLAILVPRMKADFDGRCGIVHYS